MMIYQDWLNQFFSLKPGVFFSLLLGGAFTILFLLIASMRLLGRRKKVDVPVSPPSSAKPSKANHVITSHDIRAIAGEDLLATQLDLARAYIEIDKKVMAKKILNHVIQFGTPEQIEQANTLLKQVHV